MTIDCRITMVDDYGRSMSKGVETVDTVLATAITHVTAFLTALEDVTDMGWQKQDYLGQGVITKAPVAGANRDTGATLRVTLNTGKNYAFKVPAIKSSLLNADGSVKIENIAITTLVALFETAGYLRVSDGNYVTAILGGSLDK